MTLEQRINAFVSLGDFMSQFAAGRKNDHPANELFYSSAEELIVSEKYRNPWFVEKNVRQAIVALGAMLKKDTLENWLSAYNTTAESVKKIGIVMAGNIPMVGFHDLMCVLLAGHELHAKLSSQDKTLLAFFAKVLTHIEAGFEEKIHFHKTSLKDCDAYIATGTNNSARYFEHYFGKYPNIIRRNRNSVAVLEGTETQENLKEIGKDIFDYFGLGCRNITKLYVPENYDFDQFFKAIYDYHDIVNHSKYGNNYDYNKAIYLMGSLDLLDNGFVLLKEDEQIASPVGVLFYEYYKDADKLKESLIAHDNEIQCVVAKDSSFLRQVPPGMAQCPAVDDYADGVDTMAFLTTL